MAITSGAGIAGGGAPPDASARNRGFAGAARVAASGTGLAAAVAVARAAGLALGTLALAVRTRDGAGDADRGGTGPAATGGAIDACSNGSLPDVPAGFAAVACAGTSMTRRSGASIRRSRQGKPKPGSPSPWPLKVRLNRAVCISRESRSAKPSRLRSALVRGPGHGLRPAMRGDCAAFGSSGGGRAPLGLREPKRAPPSLLGHGSSLGAGGSRAQCDCRRDRTTGHGLADAPRRHS